MNLVDLFKRLKAKHFSGVMLLHFQNGNPKLAEFTKDRVNLREVASALASDLDKDGALIAESTATK